MAFSGDDGSESRLHSWHGEEESAASIKQPFWRPLDRDYINTNNKRPISPENNNNNNNSSSNYSKKSKEAVLIEHTANTAAVPAAAIGSNYKLFSELEAIYKPGSSGIVVGGGGGGSTPNNQTGSGSALTSDDNPLLPGPAPCPTAIDDNQQPGHGSDTSRSGDALPAAPPSSSTKKSRKGSSGSSSRRKQRAKRRQEQMGVITAFLESLVKQVMDHQESLHSKFLEVMERRDQERPAGRRRGGSRRRRGTSARPLPGRRNGLSPLPARPPSSLSSRRSPERASTSRNSPPANPTRIRNAALWTSTMSTGATTVSPTVSSSILAGGRRRKFKPSSGSEAGSRRGSRSRD
ncbi:putative trihelix transcription factor GTL1 [Iris pallida]|uniref:Trihelix transcription factor GTL1 n=1 Tax=Iris pallida TaxID=29817 RepID=A0AAX6FQU2_IRIPA|nr:putative trihelix transcription factor GTL1 [Iris pallida]KAJ6818331.1 putative trihelix transcription factor GTL1 [Iris pallida]